MFLLPTRRPRKGFPNLGFRRDLVYPALLSKPDLILRVPEPNNLFEFRENEKPLNSFFLQSPFDHPNFFQSAGHTGVLNGPRDVRGPFFLFLDDRRCLRPHGRRAHNLPPCKPPSLRTCHNTPPTFHLACLATYLEGPRPKLVQRSGVCDFRTPPAGVRDGRAARQGPTCEGRPAGAASRVPACRDEFFHHLSAGRARRAPEEVEGGREVEEPDHGARTNAHATHGRGRRWRNRTMARVQMHTQHTAGGARRRRKPPE